MKNPIADEALKALSKEANRVSDKRKRESAMKKVAALRVVFEGLDDEKTDNPPGKSVVRDKNGNVVGLQG